MMTVLIGRKKVRKKKNHKRLVHTAVPYKSSMISVEGTYYCSDYLYIQKKEFGVCLLTIRINPTRLLCCPSPHSLPPLPPSLVLWLAVNVWSTVFSSKFR